MLYDISDPQFFKYEVVKKIRAGEITNLLDVNWFKYTHNWSQEDILYIVENVPQSLMERVTKAILLSYKIWLNSGVIMGSKKTLEWLERLSEYVSQYSSFRIETDTGSLTDGVDSFSEKVTLPDELNTDEAKKIFPKAVKAGLMQPLSNRSGYQWNRSNAMLAYLCGKIFCGDSLKQDIVTKEWMLKRGETFFPETALMSLFVNEGGQAIKNLGQSRLQMQRPPKGYEDIDRLFDEAT